jgi:hypothetical protein
MEKRQFTINETFTTEEEEKLKAAKEKSGLTWHDFIMKRCTKC